MKTLFNKYMDYKNKYLKYKQKYMNIKNKKVAFDFDGVLHLSVNDPESSGQVHPIEKIRNNAKKLKPNNYIIKKIYEYYEDGYTVFIITHRPSSEINTVNDFCKIHGLNEIIAPHNRLFAQGNKGDLMKHHNIKILFDDSANVLENVKSKYPDFKLYHIYNKKGKYNLF